MPLDEVIGWDSERRTLISDMEELQGRRNKAAEEVGKLKRRGSTPPEALVQEMNNVREQVKEKERFLVVLEQKIEDFLLRIPNIPDESVPAGKDEKDNPVIRQTGEIPQFAFEPKPHWEIGEKLGILNFEVGAKISGSGFAFMKGAGCLLERGLIAFMLDTHREAGYTEVMAPYL